MRLFSRVDVLSRNQKRAILFACDVGMAPVALFLAVVVLHGLHGAPEALVRLWPMFPIIALMAGLASWAFGLPRVQLKAYESLGISATGYYASTLTVGLFLLTRLSDLWLSGAGIILFGMTLFLVTVLARTALLKVLIWVLNAGRHKTRVLIYGAGNTGLQLALALKTHESISAVAFLDDDPALASHRLAGLRIYPASAADQLIRNRDVNRVLLAMPSLSQPKLVQISRRLQALGVDVQVLPSFAQLVGTEALVDTLTPVKPGRFLGRSQLEDTLRCHSSETYQGRSVLVTGAGGSVGSELCRQLLEHGPCKLVLFEVSEIALYNIERELQELSAESSIQLVAVLGSVTDARIMRGVMAEHAIDVVFHAAAYKHVPLVESNPIAGLANNVLGTRVVAAAASDAGVERFTLISTDKAVRPTNVMGASKRLAELVIQDMAKRSEKTRFSIVRFGNVLGSSGSVIPLFKDQISRGGPVTLTHEDVTRYFMTISEASRLVLLASAFSQDDAGRLPLRTGPKGCDVFVLDMGKPVKIRHLAEQMIHAAGYTVRDERNPDGDIEISVIGLRPGEKLHEELLIGKGLLTTPHPKILRAEEESLSELEMAKALKTIGHVVSSGDVVLARQTILDLVRPQDAMLETELRGSMHSDAAVAGS
jgi:FlaA1/EpsC-like NDP-sugar epimerase